MARTVNRDINERIRAICDEVYGGNTTRMAKATYISRSTILSIIGEQQSAPGYEVLRRIAEVKTPKININWLITGQGDMLDDDEAFLEKKPRLPMTAAAGYLSNFSESASIRDCEMMPVVRSFPSYDFTIVIKGDSMYPKYESGDEIAIVKASKIIEWGKTYVLDTRDGAIVKRIYDEGDKIKCSSLNPQYADFYIDKEDIFGIYRIVGQLRY